MREKRGARSYPWPCTTVGLRAAPRPGRRTSDGVFGVDIGRVRRFMAIVHSVQRSDPVIEQPPTRHAGGPITGNQVVL